MRLFPILMIGVICFVLIKSLIAFIHGDKPSARMRLKESRFSTEIFYTLLLIYSVVIIGFGLIFFILSFQGTTLVEYGNLENVGVFGSLIHSMYFSGVTLLTIGYGDVTPVGIGRLVALLEALIGYVLPTAFVLRLVQTNNKRGE